jgi:HK97 family phage portal protein
MNWKFWRRQEMKQTVGSSSVYIPGVGRIMGDRLYNYIMAFRLSDVIYGCITLIQQAAVLVPWYVYRRTGEETAEVEKHPLVDFIKRPDARMAWSRYIETHIGHLLLTGNVYQRFFIPSFKTKASVRFLRPDRVTPKLGPLGTVRYEYRTRGMLDNVLDEEVLHIKLFNPEEDEDHLEGFSPVATIAKSVDIASYALEWMLRLLEKGAQPTLALSMEGMLTNEQKAFLKEQIKTEILGPENAMNPLILEGGLKPFVLGFSPRAVEFDATMKAVLRRVCGVYKVPSELMGDTETKTYSNVTEAEKALYYKATLPHLNTLRDELNAWLVPKFDDSGLIFLNYDVSGLDALSEDMEKVWERAGMAVDRGTINRNEAREMMKYGKSPEPGAEQLTVSAAVVPLEAVTGTGTDEE